VDQLLTRNMAGHASFNRPLAVNGGRITNVAANSPGIVKGDCFAYGGREGAQICVKFDETPFCCAPSMKGRNTHQLPPSA
jgi:hypothetical protein